MIRRERAVAGWVALLWAALGIGVGWPLLRLAAELDGASLIALGNPALWRAAVNTVWLAVGVTAFAVVGGVPLGLLVARTDLPGAERWRALWTLPYLVPPLVMAVAWVALLNPSNGALNLQLRAVGFAGVDLYGLGGMVWILGLELLPLVLLATADAAARSDPSLEEAARVAGATPTQVLRRVTLPLLAPAVAEASGAVLASSAASFGVPYLLATGGTTPAPVLTTFIYQALDLSPRDGRPQALAACGVLLAFGLGLPALARRGAARWTVPQVGGKAARPSPIALGSWRWPVAVALAGGWAFAVLLPLVTLAATSLLVSFGKGYRLDNLGLEPWIATLGRPAVQQAIARSLVVAAGAATVATAVGVGVALLAERTEARGRRALLVAARAPYAVPGTVLALGMLLAWSQEIRWILAERVTVALALSGTAWLVGLAWAVKFLAIPTGSAVAALGAVDRSLEEAARVAGTTAVGAWRRVTLPLLRADLGTAWLLVFLPAVSEVTLAILLCGPESRVLGAALFELQTYGDPPGAAVLSVVTAMVVLAGNGALRWMSGRKHG